MTAPMMHPLEQVLRLIAQQAPEPWYPRLYAAQTGVPLEQLNYLLEHLWLDGLIQKGGERPDAGSGLVLSPAGQRLLGDEAALQRLRQGQALVAGDPGGTVREAFRRPVRPVVTYLLLLANLLVFGYSCWLASRQPGLLRAFVGAGPSSVSGRAIVELAHQSGGVSVLDLVRGSWWRLLSACFVQIGLLHLGFNMMVLYTAGRQAEAMWGHVRFLVIYLLGGLAGSLLGVLWQLSTLAGASGALCGVLAAEAIWFFLNRRYLPGSLVRRVRSSFVVTLTLLVVISLVPGVSGWGHLGGALGGGAAAWLLNVQRFAPSPWRWLAVIPLLLSPLAGWALVERARVSSSPWKAAEEVVFEQDYLRDIGRVTRGVERVYRSKASPLLERHATRRDARQVDDALAALQEQEGRIDALAARLDQAGPYGADIVEEARQTALEYLRAQRQLLELAGRCLRAGEAWTAEDEKALQQQQEAVDQRREAWQELLE